MTKSELNNLLRDALMERNLHEVERLLSEGADPNFKIPKEEYIDCSDYQYQPYSPLRLIVHIISDCMIGDKELCIDYESAKLLLKHGADAISAVELIESRYGKNPNPEAEQNPFSKILMLIEEAAKNL